MTLKKIEIAFAVLTLVFAIFTGGYLAGRRGEVNIIETQDGRALTVSTSADNAETEEKTPEETEKQVSGMPDPAAGDDTKTLPKDAENVPDDTAVYVEYYNKININTAKHGELTDLPGIGDAIASRIIEYREINGEFKRVEDIKNVSGIGEKKFDAIKDYIYTD